MRTCKTIACVLAKGGTGKSTSCINIGVALALQGHKVALIDNDPQGSMSTALGLVPKTIKHTLATKMLNVLDDSEGLPIADCLIPCGAVDLLPSNQRLTLVEQRLTGESKSALLTGEGELPAELVMRKTLEPLRELYDYILIDCQPSAGLLTINALAAADSILIPMESHFLSFEAVKQTLELITRIRAAFNPALAVEGILLTKYQDRTTLCRGIRNAVQETYGDTLCIFTEPIAFSIRAAEQSVCGESIFVTDPHGKIAHGYMAAAREVIAHG